MLHTQATCDYHVVQQSVWHCQQHRWATRDPTTYRHHHPPGKNLKYNVADCSYQVKKFKSRNESCYPLFFFQVSSMGITPFFVENVSELQLCAIKLVTAVSLCFFSYKCADIQCLSKDTACNHLFGFSIAQILNTTTAVFFTVKCTNRLLSLCVHPLV